ncbi:hypothetical protein F0562_025173 [Nyssa sinensis]|uniref:Uncharacterized protein n=1 Tax=Nyssa sinensis TaxID=561372 RepID=A0A5J5BG09_9ASTE|nr:hypothetical protein F0562_025173 [Nyssa sinensis]
MYRPVLPRAKPDLLLPGGECGWGLRVGARGPGREGLVEVRNCSLLRRSRNRGKRLAVEIGQGSIAVVVMVVDTVAAAAVAVDVTMGTDMEINDRS